MTNQELRETVGMVGVIASLLFVGLQIRQNSAIVRAQTRQALTTEYREFWMTLAMDDELDSLRGPSLVGDEQKADLVQWVRLRLLENVFQQFQEGVIDEQVLLGYGWSGDPEYRTPEFAAWWGPRRGRFHPDFVAAFEARQGLVIP
jgi:hypothetical protein